MVRAAQVAFLEGRVDTPARLRLGDVAHQVESSSESVLDVLSNKTVKHASGTCRFVDLVDPDLDEPGALTSAFSPRPPSPDSAAAANRFVLYVLDSAD